MKAKDNSLAPMPELLSRNDTEHGRWTVRDCEPRRGIPMTSIVGRDMLAPVQDSPNARCIRAHEMMHAKVSPADSFFEWQERKIASVKALTVVEELRVNYLCTKAGFNMKEHLTDGGEMADGERCVALGDWSAAVAMTIACATTASQKAFLTGVRRHDRKWGKMLLDIAKRAKKEMDLAYKTGTLASTEICPVTKLSPVGFVHTERIAEWVDRLMEFDPNDEPDDEKGKGEGDAEDEGEGEATGETKKATGAVRPTNSKKSTKGSEGTGTPRTISDVDAHKASRNIPSWMELKIEKVPMPKLTKGNLGKKRVASDTGKNPRRMHRLLTDPDRKIFDRVIRGQGGVVLIDASGSMSFSHSQIREIVESAPGCTVAMYSDLGNNSTNMWILAEKGKMCETLPKANSNNGVDFPALQWAIKQRQRSSSPVIWVTDGGVVGTHGMHDILTMQCVNECLKNRVIVVEDVTAAKELLRAMQNGQKKKREWPGSFTDVYRRKNGGLLPE